MYYKNDSTMALMALSTLLFMFMATTVQAQFFRSETILFQDFLENERIGEFPSRWDHVRGNAGVGHHDGTYVIAFFQTRTEIRPRTDALATLPASFSIELDYLMNDFRQHAYEIRFTDERGRRSATLYINGEKVSFNSRQGDARVEGHTPFTRQTFQPGWRQLSFSLDQGHLRVFVDGIRVLNAPRLDVEIAGFVIQGGRPENAKPNADAFIRNIIVAEGGISLYEQVVSQGKFSTNDIYFAVNRADIKPESMVVIHQIFHLMQDHPELSFSIEGHTDSDGGADHNQHLSEQRAASVMQQLISLGIAPHRLTARGWGLSKPIADNNTAAGKAQNRRVEFVMQE